MSFGWRYSVDSWSEGVGNLHRPCSQLLGAMQDAEAMHSLVESTDAVVVVRDNLARYGGVEVRAFINGRFVPIAYKPTYLATNAIIIMSVREHLARVIGKFPLFACPRDFNDLMKKANELRELAHLGFWGENARYWLAQNRYTPQREAQPLPIDDFMDLCFSKIND